MFRRSARVGLSFLRTRLRTAELALYYAEAERRLSEGELRDRAHAERALNSALKGRTVFVVGTGPSLNELPLDRLTTCTVIGVNSLFRHQVMSRWQPQYYCLMDENFFEPSAANVRYFEDMRRVLPGTTFLTTSRVREKVRDGSLLPAERTYFVTVDGDISDDYLRPTGFDELVPCAPNSVMFASLAATLMGASRIILLGADHDWLVKTNAEQRKDDPHFYAQKEEVAPSTSIDAQWNPYRSYLTTIEYCRFVWRGYYVLKEFARQRGVEILNATPGGRLDVFPAIPFDQAVAAALASPR